MFSIPRRSYFILCSAALLLFFSASAGAATLCVNPHGSHGCYATIGAAVAAANPNDTINVGPGTYKEEVDIGMPLSLIGSGAGATIIDATSFAHGVFVDGFDHPGLNDVTIAGFTVENALYEGVLVVSASDVTIRDNRLSNNDQTPDLNFTGMPTACVGHSIQPGNGTYETDESGDCGGALHLVGTVWSIVSGNLVTDNADGILISDETAVSRDNLVIHNTFRDNPLECGIVLASHPPSGSIGPAPTYTPNGTPHFGVIHNTISGNTSIGNGVQIGGAGVGLFSDGIGPGTVANNVIIGNKLIGNGLGGVTLHTHVGPAFGAPADDMDGNQIIGNYIAENLADFFDTATPGTVGININSGGGGSPVRGTVISHNVIREEDVDIAINTPAEVDIRLNDLLGGKIGVANVCAFDNPNHLSVCTGSVDATENYWGCDDGPGAKGACSTVSGTDVRFAPWLRRPATDDDDRSGNDH